MEAILINVERKSDLAFLMELAKKLGMPAKALTKEEMEDWQFAKKIDAGMKTENASRNSVMKVLGK